MWSVLLLLVVTANAFPSTPPYTTPDSTYFIYDSALGMHCDSDTNCGGLVASSMCLNGTCVCQPGLIPQGIMNCVYPHGMNNLLTTSYL
ncbi:unnamed protein product [Rotaria sp. Silwood2]|nr:unnamed protein product [Rotaria sp. Silwood2]CAF2981150.1 unnamed protein product [Rotaria sp. Silwood2]CAF3323776.1 unnamed protein product [Rotaria sp. Silwood2]CAF3410632.1 unnamed protein product [Rotaria sp. Silwood2]CAF4338138.1 unnamed protein product [Rotaria sp. Silwood2]